MAAFGIDTFDMTGVAASRGEAVPRNNATKDL